MPHTYIFCHFLSLNVFLYVFTDVIQPYCVVPPLLISTRIYIYILLSSCSWFHRSPSFLNTWPYRRSRFRLRKVEIGSVLASLQMSSFVTWSFLALPLAYLISRITVVCCFLCVIHCPAFRPVCHCWLYH